jgi:glutaminyl-peptide cyclotransferase
MTNPWLHLLLSVLLTLHVASNDPDTTNTPAQRPNLENINNPQGATIKELLIPRPPGSPNHQRVQAHLRAWFRQLGWHEQVHSFVASTPKGPLPMANLVFTQNPLALERIVLAAHYDSKLVAMDGKKGEEGVFVGATDSALPCAMIVELCRALTKQLEGSDKNVTLQAVFFDGEEAIANWTASDSLYGSRQLAQLWAAPSNSASSSDQPSFTLKNMKLMILLDLLGAANPRIPIYSDATALQFKQLVSIEHDLTTRNIIHNQPSTANKKYFEYYENVGQGIYILDDHVPFHQAGFRQILHLIPSPFPSVWHRMADDGSALDAPTIDDLTLILWEFLKLQLA